MSLLVAVAVSRFQVLSRWGSGPWWLPVVSALSVIVYLTFPDRAGFAHRRHGKRVRTRLEADCMLGTPRAEASGEATSSEPGERIQSAAT